MRSVEPKTIEEFDPSCTYESENYKTNLKYCFQYYVSNVSYEIFYCCKMRLIWFSLMNMRLLKRIRFVVVQHLLYAFQKDCIGRRIEIYCFSFSDTN
ncbi:hypothetical protein T4B_11434 [Trichinella pseudospiralis]|uniref:Uncharacterized protein n=1 Tax=Trichinella pseudospiralis TaxID=6337 RepID=A0A0V1J601_TRIPS|nr:hypothetical protein T4B_11434 [Trichinella pseudospiralis]